MKTFNENNQINTLYTFFVKFSLTRKLLQILKPINKESCPVNFNIIFVVLNRYFHPNGFIVFYLYGEKVSIIFYLTLKQILNKLFFFFFNFPK